MRDSVDINSGCDPDSVKYERSMYVRACNRCVAWWVWVAHHWFAGAFSWADMDR